MRFSVVIPVYNVEPYLRPCLDSLRAQTWTDWEAFAVDDGSTDGSGAVLDAYAAQDSRIRVIHQANAGVATARNLALGRTGGEWIVYLDSDDVLHPRALEFFDQGVRQTADADLVSLGCVRIGETAEPSWDGADRPQWQVLDVRSSFSDETVGRSFVQTAYRSARLGDLRFPALCYGEDVVYFLQALIRSDSVVTAACPVYGYRQRGGSAVHAKSTKRQMLDDLRHYRLLMEMFERTRKSLPVGFRRETGLRLTQYLAEDYFGLDPTERVCVWPEWLSVLERYGRQPWAYGYEKLVARVAAATRSVRLLWLMGYAVHWLKCHGVNRRFACHAEGRAGMWNVERS